MSVRLSHAFVAGRSPGIVLVHGLGADGRCFDAASRHLSGGNALLIPDLAGFGKTGVVPSDFSFSLKDQADLVWALCDERGFEEVVLVGHSMGGAIAVLMAESRPGRVTHLIDAVGNLVAEDAFFSRRIVAQGWPEFRARGFESFKRELPRPKDGRPAGTYLQSLARTTALAMYRSSEDLVALSDRGRLLERFLGLACRKLYLKDEDTPLPSRSARAMAETSVPVVEVPRSGHGLMEDNPEAFYGAIDAFLKAP